MAHELAFVNGKASIAFVGEKPWHGLGQELTENASLEVWKRESGMDFEIKDSPITFQADGETKVYTGSRALFRSDTGDQLSIVSDDYKVVQPGEVLDFFKDLVSLNGMKLQTAGVLYGGRRFWALADTGRAADVLGSDRVVGNLLLVTSCDGTMATNARFVATRVVCANTLSLAMREDSKNAARVTHRSTFDPVKVKQKLGIFDDAWETFRQNITDLSKVKMSDTDSQKFLWKLLAKPNVEADKQPYTVEKDLQAIMKRAKYGMGADKTYGTLWGLLNGVTEFVDHESRNRTPDHSFWAAQFGKGNDLKSKAFEMALDFMAA